MDETAPGEALAPMHVLLHICCAACAIGPYRALTDAGHRVTGFFYNPNVHPFIEFRRRLKAVKVLQERLPMPVIYDEEYGLLRYLQQVDWDARTRCADCYRLRLERTAELAVKRDIPAITTTLLGSTHQDVDLIARIGREAAERHGREFLVEDWRPLAEAGHDEAKRIRLYLQNYCGCIFSEHERFRDTSTHVYRGPGPLAEPNGEADE